MATEKLVTLNETLSKRELDAIVNVKSRITNSYEKLDALYGSIEKTKDLISKTSFSVIPPEGGVYDDATTSTGMAYQSMKAIDALKNRVGNVEIAFDAVQGMLDSKYSPPTGWEKIFGSKERTKIGRQYAEELEKIQKMHREILWKNLEHLENMVDGLKDKVETDFDSQEPSTSALEAYRSVINAISESKEKFLEAHHEIVGLVGGRQKEGNCTGGDLMWARYAFGDESAGPPGW